jgi:hypothetical protein
MTTRASLQKASSVGHASGSSMIAARISASVIERRRRQSVLALVFEMVPEVSWLMRFRPPGRYDVALVAVTIGVDHGDHDAIDKANCVGAFLTIVETVVDLFYGRSVKNFLRSVRQKFGRVLKGDPMAADIGAFFAGSHVNHIRGLYGMYLQMSRCEALRRG